MDSYGPILVFLSWLRKFNEIESGEVLFHPTTPWGYTLIFAWAAYNQGQVWSDQAPGSLSSESSNPGPPPPRSTCLQPGSLGA